MAPDIKLKIALLISAMRPSHWEGPDQVREARFTVSAANPISASAESFTGIFQTLLWTNYYSFVMRFIMRFVMRRICNPVYRNLNVSL